MNPACIDEGRGPAVLLLHGSMSDKGMWSALRHRLVARHRVITIDLPGVGESAAAPESRFRLADEAAHVAAALDERLAADDGVHLVGHGYGASVALHLALARPQQVDSLALFEPTLFHPLAPDDADMIALRIFDDAVPHADPAFATRRWLRYWHGEDMFEHQSSRRREALAASLPKAMREWRAQADEVGGEALYRRVLQPVCLVTSPASPPCVVRIVERLYGLLPMRGLHRVPGGHMAPVRSPDGFGGLVERFLGDPCDAWRPVAQLATYPNLT